MVVIVAARPTKAIIIISNNTVQIQDFEILAVDIQFFFCFFGFEQKCFMLNFFWPGYVQRFHNKNEDDDDNVDDIFMMMMMKTIWKAEMQKKLFF